MCMNGCEYQTIHPTFFNLAPLLQKSRDFHHAFLCYFQSTPHSFHFLVGSFHCNFVFSFFFICRELDIEIVYTIPTSPIVNTSIRTDQGHQIPIGLTNYGQHQIMKLDIQHQTQRKQTTTGAKYQETCLRYTALYYTAEFNGFSSVNNFVIVRLHVSHNFSRLLSQSYASPFWGIFSCRDICFAFDFGGCTSLDLTPDTRETQSVQSQNCVVTGLAITDTASLGNSGICQPIGSGCSCC
mmetsp:Transcript_12333/g.16156  ORF Transcript_12333/g.16156 Transcript_12333/m.16156 type:complete len:239 (+) Transcript_12333:120-836(+)